MAEDEENCFDEYKWKGLVARSANLICQSPIHNIESPTIESIAFDFDFWNQIFKISDFNAILNLCNHPDPKAPRLVVRQAAPVRGAENTGRGGRFSCPFYAISSVPDAFVKFL